MGKSGSASKLLPLRWAAGLAALTLLAGGCCTPRGEPTTTKSKSVAPAAPAVAADYTAVFSDELDLQVGNCPDCPKHVTVRPDGRISLANYGEVFAEGRTAIEIGQMVACATGARPENVHCQVTPARGRVVHVLGPGVSKPQTVTYTGPERVADVLKRAGNVAVDADQTNVTVVRRNVARGKPTETFPVNLTAIRHGDQRTNIVLEPNDEIHIPEGHGVLLASFLPDVRKP